MLMLRFTWGNSLGLQSTPRLWSDLRDFLQRTSREVHLDEINDDLVGFFQLSSPPTGSAFFAGPCASIP